MARMSKLKFIEEMGLNDREIHCDVDYALSVWRDDVEPYLELITHYRNKDKFLNEDIIRMSLGVSKILWSEFKKMPTLRMYLDLEKDIMSMKAKKDIVRGVSLAPDNGKLLELQAKRFDSFYHEDGKPQNDEIKVKFTVEDGSMSERDIEKKSGIKEDDVK